MTILWWNVFLSLVHDNVLNRTDPIHLECICLSFLRVVQCHLDTFKDTWNHHRMRANRRNDKLSLAIPNNVYNMSLRYGIIDYAFPLPSTIDELSGIQDTRTMYQALLPLISAYDVDNIQVFHKSPHT